jgi:hypothetical protein
MDQMNLLLVAVVARNKWDMKFNEKKRSFFTKLQNKRDL